MAVFVTEGTAEQSGLAINVLVRTSTMCIVGTIGQVIVPALKVPPSVADTKFKPAGRIFSMSTFSER